MTAIVVDDAGVIRLNSETYRHVQIQGQLAWTREYVNEPPWAEVSPPLVSDPQFTWDQGGFKSRQGLVGTSEYGTNTDSRFPFRLLPGPLVTVVTLTSSPTQPTSIFEALGYIWVVAGRYVYRIDPATDGVVNSKDLGATVVGIMGLRWETNIGLVTTDEASNSLYKVTAIGTPDTWTQTTTVSAYRLAMGINRLFKVSKTGALKNILTSLDPMTEANWADSVQMGDTFSVPTSISAYERTVLVGKPEGLFAVGEEGFGIPVIRRMPYDANNCYGTIVHEPWVYIPHSRGLYRFQPGLVESCGLEKEIMNESAVKGQIYAMASDGDYLYAFADVGNDCYLLTARERRGGEGGFGPLVWDTLAQWTAAHAKAAYVSNLTTPARLWFSHGNNVAYVKLQPNGGVPNVDDGYRFALSGTRFSPRYKFDDWAAKDFPKIVVVGKNLTAARYWQVAYSLDGAAYQTTDVDVADMKISADGRKTFFLPTTATGREIQYRFTVTSNDSTVAPPELSYFEPFATPRPRTVPIVSFHLQLEAGTRHGPNREIRTATKQFNDLQTLLEQVAAISTTGPWGDSSNAWIRGLELVESRQSERQEVSLIVKVTLQLREQS